MPSANQVSPKPSKAYQQSEPSPSLQLPNTIKAESSGQAEPIREESKADETKITQVSKTKIDSQ